MKHFLLPKYYYRFSKFYIVKNHDIEYIFPPEKINNKIRLYDSCKYYYWMIINSHYITQCDLNVMIKQNKILFDKNNKIIHLDYKYNNITIKFTENGWKKVINSIIKLSNEQEIDLD